MKFHIIFVSLWILIPNLSFCIQTKYKFVNDLIENEEVPSILSVKSCWSKYHSIQFTKHIKVAVQFRNNLTTFETNVDQTLNANKLWFFVDMRCNDSFNFLEKVCVKISF